jgi:hypothetical protein
MAKANDPDNTTANKAAASKKAVTVTPNQTKSDSIKTKPVTAKAKAPAKKAAKKATGSKETLAVKTEESKSISAKKKPVAEKVKTPVAKAADNAGKAEGAFAKKMDEVKSTAKVIGHKIAAFAKDANEAEEGLKDAIVLDLHEMKKDIHRVAENIAEKTKE